MSRTLIRLAERRNQLVARAAAQRMVLTHNLENLRAPLAYVDQGLSALRYVWRHPLLLVGSVLLLAIWRPRVAGKWLSRGWMVWQIGRRLGSSK
jgi:hypothetical protein